jgi:Fur family peroxide stress response transcriptional regulator
MIIIIGKGASMTGKRKSVQKRVIVEALGGMDHPTAAEVYERVRLDCPQISLGTVYRNLGSMADEGEVLRLSFAGEPDRFDPNIHEHFHVVCGECGRIFDTDHSIASHLIQKLDHAVEECTGVRVDGRSLFFSGVCAACRKARDTEGVNGTGRSHREAAI